MCARQTQPAYAYNLCAATLCPADATVLVPVPTDNMALSPLVKPGTLKKSGVASSGTTTTEPKSRGHGGGQAEPPATSSFAMAFVVWVSMVIPITLLLAQVSSSCFHSHARHMWMLAGSSTCVMALLHLSWRWIFRGRMNAGFAALNVAEATMIGVVATTFACSDHSNVMAYCRGPYINVGALFYALIASLLSKEAAKSPMHHGLCLHHAGFLVVFLAQWRDPDMEKAYWQLNAAYSVDLLAVCTAIIRNSLVLRRGGMLKLPYQRASAHLKLAYVLVEGAVLPWGLYNRISHLPFWTPFMGGSLLILLPALWCLSTAVVSMSSPAGSTTAAEVKAKTIVPRTHRQQDLILAHRIVRQMSR